MMTIGTKWMMTFSIQMMMNNHNHNLLLRIFERAAANLSSFITYIIYKNENIYRIVNLQLLCRPY